MNTFSLKIYTAERPFFEGECESLIVPTTQGLYGIMARHSDMVAALSDGELQYRQKGATVFEHVAISPGIVAVTKNEVVVLTETAERASDIDYARAMRQYESAKEDLKKEGDPISHHLSIAKLSRSLNRLKIRSKLGK